MYIFKKCTIHVPSPVQSFNCLQSGVSNSSQNFELNMWHRHLGHCTHVFVEWLISTNLIPRSSLCCNWDTKKCSHCELCKIRELSFHNINKKASELFEIIYFWCAGTSFYWFFIWFSILYFVYWFLFLIYVDPHHKTKIRIVLHIMKLSNHGLKQNFYPKLCIFL